MTKVTSRLAGSELKKRVAEGKDKPAISTGRRLPTQSSSPPRAIVDKWVELIGTHKSDRDAAMWDAFGWPRSGRHPVNV